MPGDTCPWLGIGSDRKVHHAGPNEEHLCYARKRPEGIAPAYQGEFCLSEKHRQCRWYLALPAPAAAPAAALGPAEDLVGPAPRRRSAARLVVWAVIVVMALAVVIAYGRAVVQPDPTELPRGAAPSAVPAAATASVIPTATAAPLATEAAIELRTATPTPVPGGTIYGLSPDAGDVGWVAGDEERGNHLGDSYLYSGVFDGVVYHGAAQFDLAAVPRGARLYSAALELTGLDARRLPVEGSAAGEWEVRLVDWDAEEEWRRATYQQIHNAAVRWSLSPALAADDLAMGKTNSFVWSQEQLDDLERRLAAGETRLSVRIDGPLAGENRVFAWDSGWGPATQGRGPRLIVSAGPPPKTPPPTLAAPTATATGTPVVVLVVVTSTPTPANAVTAAAVAARETARATTTGTPTPLVGVAATATPRYVVITNTPRPENYATATYLRQLATAHVVLTGTPTPTPPNLVTATSTPRPTRTPVFVWLDEMTGTPTPDWTATPAMPPLPNSLRGKILFLSDRGDETGVYLLDPASGRVALVTARWPYDVALQGENRSPDGGTRAFVQNDGQNVPQIYLYSREYGSAWQLTYNAGMSYDPVWSPLGDRVAFVSTEGGNDELYVIGTDGKEQRRLTFNGWEWDKHPTWSPDGKQLVFWSNEGSGRRQLWIIDADGRNRRLLLSSRYNDWDPVWVK